MTPSPRLPVAAIAALYVLWLMAWVVFESAPYGLSHHHWDQVAAAGATAGAAWVAAWFGRRPYRGFFVLHGIAFWLLAASWATYQTLGAPGADDAISVPGAGVGLTALAPDALYALFAFTTLCAWGYLALERWGGRPLTALTTFVFSILMIGLGAVFASFYITQYASQVGTPLGRLDAATAVLEFAVVVAGLLCVLLRVPAIVVWMLVGTAILIAGDMAYSVEVVPPVIEAVWMAGQLLWLAAIVWMARTGSSGLPEPDPARGTAEDPADPDARSGLSGILILLSLGAVLLSPLVWFLPGAAAWKSFFSVLFIVSLTVVLVWITDRFDDAVVYLRRYVRRVLRSQLVSDDWRAAPPRIRDALQSTRLGVLLDDFRGAAAQLKHDVLFLGPERLYGPPRLRAGGGRPSCFIVMPFGQEWSSDVHRILARACEAAGVRAVRGDDLFTPTDILEDIWQAIHAADFVVADISGRNPNVLYELGIAHTLAKPVLILSRLASDIPIDLATRRVILYGQAAGDWHEDLAQKISAAVGALVADYGFSRPAPAAAPTRPAPP